MKSRLVSFALLAASCSLAYGQDSWFSPPDESVGGKSQAEWSREWWQWAGSFERNESPIADRTGELCGSRQAGPVWFLAGTYGTQRTVRSCRVPAGKHLFFPLVNYVVMPTSSQAISCMVRMSNAARMTEGATNLVVDLNGRRISNLQAHRQASPDCFDMGARTANQMKIYPSASNGYYVMIRPLAPGVHTLNFGGALPTMQQAVTYTLIVD